MPQKESQEGKLNAVSLRMVHSNGVMTEEEAFKKVISIIDIKRRELLKLVLQEKGSIVPKACGDLFWKTIKVESLTYISTDGFTTEKMKDVIKEVIYDPISVNK